MEYIYMRTCYFIVSIAADMDMDELHQTTAATANHCLLLWHKSTAPFAYQLATATAQYCFYFLPV
jgi:hypothetical protein